MFKTVVRIHPDRSAPTKSDDDKSISAESDDSSAPSKLDSRTSEELNNCTSMEASCSTTRAPDSTTSKEAESSIFDKTISNTFSKADIDERASQETEAVHAAPLSTTNTLIIVALIAIFSFIYLGYAQHHKKLFYIMTSLIAVWIIFLYIAGICSVLYMVIVGYKLEPQSEDVENDAGEAKQQESMI